MNPKAPRLYGPSRSRATGNWQQQIRANTLYNQLLAIARVKVEHVIAGVNRIRIVQKKTRLQGEQIRNKVMLIAFGLHNLRIAHRSLS
jgi:hypothetical protein